MRWDSSRCPASRQELRSSRLLVNSLDFSSPARERCRAIALQSSGCRMGLLCSSKHRVMPPTAVLLCVWLLARSRSTGGARRDSDGGCLCVCQSKPVGFTHSLLQCEQQYAGLDVLHRCKKTCPCWRFFKFWLKSSVANKIVERKWRNSTKTVSKFEACCCRCKLVCSDFLFQLIGCVATGRLRLD